MDFLKKDIIQEDYQYLFESLSLKNLSVRGLSDYFEELI